ncbi:type VI secretion system protein ImpI [Pararobbsia alpina]|uniref:type VI secretion system-associated FHA domain protein TagH n=1 Tax=Pararobbsia alpina TaxID=621374 RepID=UPI0039A46A97
MSAVQPLTLALSGDTGRRKDGQARGHAEHIFDARDGSIGRSEDCDWVLSADGVSRVHALVRYLNGMYFVEDRSTNGMLLNGAPMRKGEPAALKHGDRIQIDTFDIDVRLPGDAQTQWNDASDSGQNGNGSNGAKGGNGGNDDRGLQSPDALHAEPVDATPRHGARDYAKSNGALDDSAFLSDLGVSGKPVLSNEAEYAESLIPGGGNMPAPGMSLDPLALFDAPSSYLEAPWVAEPPAPIWSHTPALSDRFRPPAPEPGPSSAPLLPDDWNATHVEVHREPVARDESAVTPSPDRGATQPVSGPSAITEVPLMSVTSAIPETPATLTTPAIPPIPATSAASHPLPVRVTEIPAPAMKDASRATLHQADHKADHEAEDEKSARQPSPAIGEPAAPPSVSSADTDLMPLLVIAVDAMMDVLRARAELKNSFRLPATLIQRSENNPLKFAPSAEDAVAKLLTASSGAFLSGRAALDDAADDIRNHQMAMLAGVRSAFDSLLAHFDPARIEEQTDGDARRFSLGGRSRQWDRYKAQFAALTQNPDECFRRLFGDEFARAYEAQLGRLKARSE